MVHAQLAPAPWGIWRIAGRRSLVADRKPDRLIASRWNDDVGAYSPDGHRFAFTSDRSGTDNVWVSNLDATDPVQVTAFDSFLPGTGAPWSPDGRGLVVISKESGSYDLYLVDTEGGRPRRLTHEPSDDGPASFSRDGHFIYFASDRGGHDTIWKMPVDRGGAVQVTRGDGFYVQESWDARSVYYSDAHGEGIWRVPVDGGQETPVVRGVGFLSGWDLSAAGLYYGTSQQLELSGEEYTIHFLDFESGRTETLFRKQGPVLHESLVVSPDEKWIAFGEQPIPQSELMLIENFR